MARAKSKFDVFISYRRSGGAAEARLIQTKITDRGWRAFLDVDDLQAGHFNQALLDRIAEAENFIVVLSPHSLDRTSDERDWLRLELEQAIRTGRNIVPILMPGFEFPKPDTLPLGLQSLHTYQSINYSHEFFNASIDRIIRYLRRQSAGSGLSIIRDTLTKPRVAVPVILALIAVVALAFALTRSWRRTRIEHGHWESLAPLPTARTQLMAAPVGTILCVVGGLGPHGDLATIEVNKIATNDGWGPMPPLPKLDPS